MKINIFGYKQNNQTPTFHLYLQSGEFNEDDKISIIQFSSGDMNPVQLNVIPLKGTAPLKVATYFKKVSDQQGIVNFNITDGNVKDIERILDKNNKTIMLICTELVDGKYQKKEQDYFGKIILDKNEGNLPKIYIIE